MKPVGQQRILRQVLIAVLALSAGGGIGIATALAGGDTSRGYRYLKEKTTVSETAQVSQRVPCPAGEPVVGGGIRTPSGFSENLQIAESAPVDDGDADEDEDDGWAGISWNGGGGAPGASEVDAHAICDVQASPSDYAYRKKTEPAPEGNQSLAEVECPQGAPVVSGGVTTTRKPNQFLFINTSYPSGPFSWRVWADNANSGPGHEFTAWAVCDRAAQAASYRHRSKSVEVADLSEGGARVNCPNDEPVVGGGLYSTGLIEDRTFISSSRPFDDGDADKTADDGWAGRSRNFDENSEPGNDTETITVHAICRK